MRKCPVTYEIVSEKDCTECQRVYGNCEMRKRNYDYYRGDKYRK